MTVIKLAINTQRARKNLTARGSSEKTSRAIMKLNPLASKTAIWPRLLNRLTDQMRLNTDPAINPANGRIIQRGARDKRRARWRETINQLKYSKTLKMLISNRPKLSRPPVNHGIVIKASSNTGMARYLASSTLVAAGACFLALKSDPPTDWRNIAWQ